MSRHVWVSHLPMSSCSSLFFKLNAKAIGLIFVGLESNDKPASRIADRLLISKVADQNNGAVFSRWTDKRARDKLRGSQTNQAYLCMRSTWRDNRIYMYYWRTAFRFLTRDAVAKRCMLQHLCLSIRTWPALSQTCGLIRPKIPNSALLNTSTVEILLYQVLCQLQSSVIN